MKLIVACTPNGGIGYENKLPWNKIQGDLPRFKALTTDKVILMGRNTWESLPKKPLPNRTNIVLTSKPIDGVLTITELPNTSAPESDVWVIGGAKLINSCWHLLNEIHLTRTIAEYTCDVFIDLVKLEKEFICVSKEQHDDHTYEIWKRQ